ncbi:MAG: hypothetical protein QM796_11195 [Chthoniobacteraceae bacterium]
MPPAKNHEPTSTELAAAHDAFDITVLGFSRVLETLEPSEVLPRYNRIEFMIRCRAPYEPRPLFLTIRRHGSEIQADNFYTVPFFAAPLSVGAEAVYELLSFDSFNLRFENIAVEMCDPEDYAKRRVSVAHVERAKKFARRKDG